VPYLRVSKLHWDSDSQTQKCTVLARTISEGEQRVGHKRTLVVGDLNMNPFEPGVVGAAGLHGVMTRQIASRGARTVQGRSYEFFYNPMWGVFGDGSPGPPGTYYYDDSRHVNYSWNVFDQVLLRPELLHSFSNDQLQVLTRAGNTLLTKGVDGVIDGRNASDHLPVLFRLNLEGGA